MKWLSYGAMAAGGGMFAGGVWMWMMLRGSQAQAPEDSAAREQTLLNLVQSAGWVEVDDATVRYYDARVLYPLWRAEHPLDSEDRPLHVNDTHTEMFFNENVRGTNLFRRYVPHRMVIFQLLELLDRHRREPSVVVKGSPSHPNGGDQLDDDYNQESYHLLSRVTLCAHTLNVARLVCEELRKEKIEFRLPSALVAALAHDIGKISALRQGASSREHPIIACEYLQTLEGFQQIKARKEILEAVRHHHTSSGTSFLAKLLRSADHEARTREFDEQKKQPKDAKQIRWTLLPSDQQVYARIHSNAELQRLPTLQEVCRRDPIGEPQVVLPCIVPVPETDDPDQAAQEPVEAAAAARPADDGQTFRDPLLVKVKRWVRETDLEEYSVDAIMDEFQVSAVRAEALYDALAASGLITTIAASPPAAAPAAQEDVATAEDPFAHLPEQHTVFALEGTDDQVPSAAPGEDVAAAQEAEPEQAAVYGTRSAGDPLPVVPDPVGPDRIGAYAEITKWFDPAPFLQNLRGRINVDKTKPRTDSRRVNKFFQAVSYNESVYVHIYALKEVVADQMNAYGDAQAAARMLVPPLNASEETRRWQRQILMKVLLYFRDTGDIDPAKFPETNLGIECTIKFETAKDKDAQLMVPFQLIAFGNVKELLARKKDNPLVDSVTAVVHRHSESLARVA